MIGIATTSGHPLTGVHVFELVVAGLLMLFGIRSLVRWLRVRYEPSGTGERVLYALHVTARVGMWIAFAGFFAGYALVDDPTAFRVYVMVPLGLAAIQLLSALALGLGRGGRSREGPGER